MTQWLTNKKKIHTILITYWLLVPVLFYLFIMLSTLQSGVDFQALIQQSPGLTIGNLNANLMFFQVALLFFISRISESRQGLLGKFTWMALAQQLLTGNIIGVVLIFFLRQSLLQTKESTHPKVLLMFYLTSGIILLLSAIILIFAIRVNIL